jgi:hypothetical protein
MSNNFRLPHLVQIDSYGIDLSAGANTNDILTYNGSSFVAAAPSGGVTSLTGGGGITVSASTGAVTLGASGIAESAVTNLTTDLSNRALTATAINTAARLTGGGDLSTSRTIDLATSGVSANSYGSASSVPTYTVDTYGRLTAASNTSIVIAESAVTNLTTDLSNRALTATVINTTSPLTGGGDLSTSRTISIPEATGSVDGYLAHTDWTTFNNKATDSLVVHLAGSENITGSKTFQATQTFENITVITDDGYSIGDLTHRYSSIFTKAINSGASALTNTTTVATGSSRAGFIWNDTNAATTDKPISIQLNATEHAYIDVNGGYNLKWATTIGTAQTTGLLLQNTTAATSGNQKYSPALALYGDGYETTTGTSQATGWLMQAKPIQAAAVTSALEFFHNANGSLTNEYEVKKQNGFITVGVPGGAYMDLYPGSTGWRMGISASSFIGQNYDIGVGAFEVTVGGVITLEVSTNFIGPRTDNTFPAASKTRRYKGIFNSANLSAGYNTQSGTTYTVLITDYYVGMSNVAARTVTLCAANAVNAGTMFVIKDEAGTGVTANITINRAGSDTIDGGTSVAVITNYGDKVLISDGSSKWFVMAGL